MTRKKSEQAYWADKAFVYDTATACVVGDETQCETSAWLSSQLLETDDVLELGCGAGRFSEAIAPKVRNLTATEASLEMLEAANGKLLSDHLFRRHF